MIFVTVGTHEDPFDRLVEAIDQLKGRGRISQDVFIQTGYSKYQPQHCGFKDFLSYSQMMAYMEKSEMIITHGGTGSIMLILYHGKIPLVVPRQKRYNEHIDDHQVIFCKTMAAREKIIAAYETSELETAIHAVRDKSPQVSVDTSNRTENQAVQFADKLHSICKELVR